LPTHGGSLRVYCAHAGSARPTAPSVSALLAREHKLGFGGIATYLSFSEQVKRTKGKLLSLLIGAKEADKVICGYGAPGKGNTLLNYCGIGTDFLEFTVDRNPYKHGRFTPGMHIPIRPVEAINAAKPDYVLSLRRPWSAKPSSCSPISGPSAQRIGSTPRPSSVWRACVAWNAVPPKAMPRPSSCARARWDRLCAPAPEPETYSR
jgi:hypothetical protein